MHKRRMEKHASTPTGPGTYVIHCLSVDTRATQGRLTFLASSGYLLSSHLGSGTMYMSLSLPCSLKKRTRSRSCSAMDSFWGSTKKNSALATRAYHSCRGRDKRNKGQAGGISTLCPTPPLDPPWISGLVAILFCMKMHARTLAVSEEGRGQILQAGDAQVPGLQSRILRVCTPWWH